MPQQLETKRLRLKLNAESFEAILDALTSATPKIVKASDVVIECGVFFKNEVVNVDNFDSVTFQVWDAATKITTKYIEEVVPSSSIEAEIEASAWTAATAENFQIELSNAQTNLAAGNYWIVFRATTDTGKIVPLGSGTLEIVLDGGTTAATEPVPDEPPYSRAEQDARFIQRHGDGSRFATDGVDLYLYFDSTAKWHKLLPQTVDGALTIGIEPTGVTSL